MVISVNGHPLALKKGSSFEYISENRLFSGSDAYTLSITFPLKDCSQNLEIFGHINRKDVSLGKVVFDCEIRDKAFYKFGSLTVVEISDKEVKCQFLEGRSEQNFDKTFDKIFINELDLGKPDIFNPSAIEPGNATSPTYMENRCVALPWVNNTSGVPHNFVDIHEIEDHEYLNYYTWSESTTDLTWQPYLIYIIKRICQEIGYDIDLTELEKDVTSRYLLICNTLPGEWDMPEFAKALPHWTVNEFFYKLELFLNGEFTIDHRAQKIDFNFTKNILQELNPVLIEKVIEEFSSELDSDGSDCEYLDAKNLLYKGDDSDAWKYYSCDWFIHERKENVVKYETLSKLISENKWMQSWINTSSMRGTNFNKVLYAADVDMHFIVRALYGEKIREDPWGNDVLEYKCVLQPVNVFGGRIVNDSEDANEEELDFMPVPVDFTEKKYGWCIFLNIGSYNEKQNNFLDIPVNSMSGTQQSILSGSNENGSEYFNSIYIGWWPGVTRSGERMPYPVLEKIEIKDDWSGYHNWNCFSMRLNKEDGSSLHSVNHKIDTINKVNFKFLSNTIPDVRTVFHIHGKRYICEKLTATFTENGMSQLIKGVFYPLID